jgi:hypothetical protein
MPVFSEFTKLFLIVDRHGPIYCNGGAPNQTKAGDRLAARVAKSTIHSIYVNGKR